MPLFHIQNRSLKPISQKNFEQEKQLQSMIEANLEPAFNCRFIASEFSTGAIHAGRIDTLALSEECNPVIIEYKKVESSELITQSLFYLYWIRDHRGDFEIAVRQTLGSEIEVDWSDTRVICIAPNFRKYDIHAVQVMGANIELWKYRLFENDTLYLEEVFQQTVSTSLSIEDSGKNPIMVAAGKKAAQTRATGTYTFDQHLERKPENIRHLVRLIQEYIINLDPAIEEVPKKLYVAYKTSQNIACMEVQQRRILLYLKLDPARITPLPAGARDVSSIGHFGTGDLEFAITSEDDIEAVIPLIEMAYQRVGG